VEALQAIAQCIMQSPQTANNRACAIRADLDFGGLFSYFHLETAEKEHLLILIADVGSG
jgi:hypothetical protein